MSARAGTKGAAVISFSRILVDVDAGAETHPALERAVWLAVRCQARIKIVDVLPDVPQSARSFLNAALEEDLAAHRRERLAAIAARVRGDLPVTVELLRGRPAISLVQEVLRSGHDLLMRSHARSPGDPDRPFGAVDMQILRQCPRPVWMVRSGSARRSPRRILAAVNVSATEETEQALNTTILELALLLKELEDAHLTILHAWTAYGESLMRNRMSAQNLAELVEAARREADKALSAFTNQFGDRLTGADIELFKGEPGSAVPYFAETHGIDVVVMGTVARTGIAGFVIGNTAERVLQRLRGSVLAVKPSGFESAVKLPAAEDTEV
jgi:nucleotide-binding universal stress UspA family protein